MRVVSKVPWLPLTWLLIATAIITALMLAGCSGSDYYPTCFVDAYGDCPQIAHAVYDPRAFDSINHPTGLRRTINSNPIEHVVIIVQENRTLDYLFNGYPGANTVQSGQNSLGQTVPLAPISLSAPYTIYHTHPDFLAECNLVASVCEMNGFDREPGKCQGKASQCPPANQMAYGKAIQYEVQPYWDMAAQYVLADEMFATQAGPSFPGHQYLVSGTSSIANGSSLRASENPETVKGGSTGGCDSPAGSSVAVIDSYGHEYSTTTPCFARLSLAQEIDAAGLTWHYYQQNSGDGLWNALDAIKPIWKQKSEYRANVRTPAAQALSDIQNGYLANVTWITPSPKSSDHAGETDGSGPSWVKALVNAIGQSQYWNNTVIFVTWDDWGGWYDHVAPAQRNSYELGMRVPLLVISPYARAGYVAHTPYEFGSILKTTEEFFGLPSMNTTDLTANDLSDCFNFAAKPRRFTAIKGPRTAQWFLHQPSDNRDPDD